MTDAEKYANDVISGKIVAGRFIILSAKRFLADLKRSDIVFDVKSGQRAVNFIERKLRHWEGSWRGKPLTLEPWQKFIVMQIFGWQSNGKRRVRSIYIQVARKNGKTSFAAAIMLYHLIADKENSPQVLVGANNEDQAKICVNSAGRILQQSPVFKELLDEEVIKLSVYGRNIISIYHKDKDGSVKAMSKNPQTQDGYSPSVGIVDEYHEAKDDALLNVIESGQGARPEPILLVITTAGFVKTGPCYMKLRKTSIDILEGKMVDDHHLAFIYEPDEADRWDDESTWIKSNPNLGVSVFPEYLRGRMQKAKNEGATKEVDFKTKNLNLWVDAPTVWIQDETWMQNAYGINPEELKGAICYGGLDLATGIDINAFCLYFPRFREINGRAVNPVLWWFWIPRSKIKTELFDYTEWVERGFITATDGVFDNIIDHKKIVTDISELHSQYSIQAIAFDQRLAYHGVVQELGLTYGTSDNDEWIQGLYPFTQSMPNVSMAAKDFEKKSMNYELEHFGNPVARWMIGNVVLKRDPVGQIMPDKSKSQNKIDGVAALLNAIALDIRISASGTIQTESFAV
jgi:phage terminase large subunit-like protein